jgi:hypothetical protein
MDVAAHAIVEMRSSAKRVFHLVHPRPIPCEFLRETISRHLGMEIKPYAKWYWALESLKRTLGPDADSVHALKMLRFFRGSPLKDPAPDFADGPILDVTNAVEAANKSLGDLKSISDDDVAAWIGYWRKSDLLN